ncbi:hypothetical protein N7474_006509 [Penicillium riverlandense]|uniref:uncharacterized protein n=1 Tax=Penicillium riverlandense TaxID=1903569 RepID=UPI002548DD73|nr:uncharacterized protein N7474_006509 [Penicillium riverlandense]KAJ5814732.1 hypothetical protein N7474_006509 [Penicillium riverlandense]
MSVSRRIWISATVNSPASFLYQTRTLTTSLSPSYQQPLGRRLHRPYSTRDGASEKNNDPDTDPSVTKDGQSQDAAENSPAPRRKSYIHQRAAALSPGLPRRRKESAGPRPLKAMTPQERETFGKLLGQLGVTPSAGETDQKKRPQKNAKSSEEGPGDLSNLSVMFESVLSDRRLMKKFEAKPKKTTESEEPRRSWGEEMSSSETSEQPEEDLEPMLDGLTYSDLGFADPATGNSADIMLSVKDAIEMVVKREAAKIETALFLAIEEGKGDMGVWDVCKERIFTMLGHLGDDAPATPSAGSDSHDGARTTSSNRSSGPLDIPDPVPAGPVVAALYPRTLLIAFRLLNTHFPSSPLVSQFRSTIKAQGRTSAVLGSSTDLHDEMISFHWNDCSDLPAVVSLLREMDLMGLKPSQKTRHLLHGILHQRKRDLAKTGKDSWWRIPQNQKAFQELAGRDGWMRKLKV